MAGIIKVLVILIMYGLSGVESQDNTCTQPNYDRCVKDLVPLLHAAETFYIKYTIGRMGELCREYQNTKACIQQFEQHCDPAVMNELQSAHAYYEYICDDTFAVFSKHRDCLVQPQLEARAHGCNSTFRHSLVPTGPGRPCGHFKAYIDCLSTEVRIICGQEAAEWQLGLDKAVLNAIIASHGCSLELESQSYCTTQNLDRCFAPLEQHPIEDGRNIVPTHTEENIIAICKSYTEVRPCIDLLIYECHPNYQRHLRSLHDSYKYVCDDHLQEYLDHRDCLTTQNLHTQLKPCHSSFENDLKSVGFSSGSAQSKYARLCQHANMMVDCIQDLVVSFCGCDAATWQRGLDVAVYSPIIGYYECEIHSKRVCPATSASTGIIKPKIIASIIIPVALTIIVLIVALLLICHRIKKNRKVPNSHVRMNEEEMGQSPAAASPRVVYTVPSPVSDQEQGAMAALPPDLLPPEYTEKPQFGEMMLAAAIAYQTSGDEVKLPLPADDDAGYDNLNAKEMSNMRGSVLEPPEYDDVDLGPGSRYRPTT